MRVSLGYTVSLQKGQEEQGVSSKRYTVKGIHGTKGGKWDIKMKLVSPPQACPFAQSWCLAVTLFTGHLNTFMNK